VVNRQRSFGNIPAMVELVVNLYQIEGLPWIQMMLTSQTIEDSSLRGLVRPALQFAVVETAIVARWDFLSNSSGR
jgi:hypothetical protein